MMKGNYKSNLDSSSPSQSVKVHAGVDSNAENLSIHSNVTTLTDALDICRSSTVCRAFKYSDSTIYIIDTINNPSIEQTFTINPLYDVYEIN